MSDKAVSIARGADNMLSMATDNTTLTSDRSSEGEQPESSSHLSQLRQAESLREHEPLTDILSMIPHKVQRGLKTQYEVLELTSVDANQYFIALGSNVGIVFLFDRANYKIERLRSEDTTDIVTCVCLHHGLDDLVAVGYASGTIYIFQLPNMMIGHSKQLERFIVSSIHQTSLTCLAWSVNGMKLFSGDKHGSVGCTEVDFYERLCKSSVLLIESNTEIVQLHHGHKSLLISTKNRCIVCRTDGTLNIAQVGSKDRKVIGDFGACFIPAMCKPEDAQLYASRPGFRIWKASINGSVLNTFMFKELISQHSSEIPLLDFNVTSITKSQNPNQFGQVLLFRDKELVTWNDSCLYVINPENTTVVSLQKHIGTIKSVTVTQSEIFVLREGTDRNLVRISDKAMTRPTSQFLRQLESERQLKSQQPAETKETKSDTKTPQSEKSPFKMFQGNILDKVKQVANPSVLVDKVQEKLSVEKKKENVSGSERNGSSDGTVSSPQDLPPVIQLDSPDLLTIEIGQVATENNSPENGSQSVAADCDISVTFLNQSDMKQTGSGACSTSARLPEDYQDEETSKPVYMLARQSEEIMSKRISVEDEPDGEDAIVFRRKVKNKKKKKGAKDKSPRKSNPELQDADSLSVHSTTSVASDSSGSNPTGRVSAIDDFGPTLETCVQEGGALVTALEPGVQEGPTQETGNQEHSTPLDTGIQEHSTPLETGIQEEQSLVTDVQENLKGSSPTMDTGALNDSKEDNLPLKYNTTEEPDTEKGKTKPEHSEEVKLSSQNLNGLVETDKINEGSKESQSVTMVSESCSIQKFQQTKIQKVDSNAGMVLPVNDGSGQTEVQKDTLTTFLNPPKDENDRRSNLDKQMAKLDSYLSETSDISYSDLERSVSAGASGIEYKSESDQFAYKSMVKKSDSFREREILSYIAESDSKYTPSSLEKELHELEVSTAESDSKNFVQDENQSMTINSPISPNSSGGNSLPSIYTIYSKPGATAEDFYSKYAPTSPSEMSSLTSDTESDRKENILFDSEIDKVAETSKFLKSVNNWTEITAQGNIHSISVSSTHIWITDRSWNIFHSSLNGPGVSWKRATGTASQISVSPDGNIVWSLNKNTVFAGTKITAKRPEGMKWVEAVRDVSYICVDNTCAWYIKTNHQVMLQKGLSKDRPCYTGKEVECAHRLKQIVCLAGVVWALTENCHWLYRSNVTEDCPEGKDWKSGDSGAENRLFSHLCLGEDNIGWAVDILGQVWFRPGVTMETPRGENHWWQVPLSGEYIIKDLTAMDMLKSFSKKFDPQKLSLLLSAQSGGLIAARNGVWVCPEYKHVMQVCRGSVEGQIWREAHPENLTSASCWKTVLSSTASQTNGLIWAQQPNGDIFAFSPDRQACCSIPGPKKHATNILFVCMSVCTDALWGLTDDGEVFIRTGMSEVDTKGSGWSKLDLSQLEDRQLVHVSCANVNVWSVDSDGMVWHRIGVKAPSDLSLNAAWLPVDNGGTVFTQVVSCQQDWKVWAIDNRRQVYVRHGITQEMPIGRRWIHVSGSPAMQITMSDNFVFALNHAGELLCRYGVSPDHVTGDYWKKLPGELVHISATPTNILWGINKEGQLMRRFTKYIVRTADDPQDTHTASRLPRGPSASEDGDWEIV